MAGWSSGVLIGPEADLQACSEGGSWFSARVRINVRDVLVVPEGLSSPDSVSIETVRYALKRCRESLLYL